MFPIDNMKKIFFATLVIFAGVVTMAQKTEVNVEANGTKIIKGFMSKNDLKNDSAFMWFAENQKGYVPDASALYALNKNRDSIHILAFGGTWCSDTKNLMPKFYFLAEAGGLSENHITLIGVDRNKKTLYNLTEAFNITHVPTFIVLKNGREIGRVVEYGKTGMFDKELGEIISLK